MLKFGTIAVCVAALLLSPMLPTPPLMDGQGWSALAVLALAIVLWLTNVLPAAVTSLLVIVLVPLFGILPFNQAGLSLGQEEIWLILSMLIMGSAVEKYGLDKRLAYSILKLSGGKIRLVVAFFIMIGFVLTFFTPNALGRLTVLLPVSLGLIETMKSGTGPNFGKLLIFTVTFTPYMCCIALITAAGGTIYAVGLFDSMLGYRWSYLEWMVLMLPLTIVVLALFWLLLLWLFPPEQTVLQGGAAYFRQELEKLGPLRPEEKKLIALYGLLALLWITSEWNGLAVAHSGLLVASILLLPGIGLLSWKETVKKIDWGLPFLFAAGFTLADALSMSGVTAWGAAAMSEFAAAWPPEWMAVLLFLSFVAIRLCFTNYTAMVASLLPVALTFAVGSGTNPLWLGMIAMVASSIGYFIPTQSAGAMVSFSAGLYTNREYFTVGTGVTVLFFIVTMAAAFFYWPLVGFSLHPS